MCNLINDISKALSINSVGAMFICQCALVSPASKNYTFRFLPICFRILLSWACLKLNACLVAGTKWCKWPLGKDSCTFQIIFHFVSYGYLAYISFARLLLHNPLILAMVCRMQGEQTEDFHPRVTVDQAEGLCHRSTLHFGRLNIETGALYYCIWIRLKYWTVVCFVKGW